MSILITGASGAFGRKAAERLLTKVEPSQLVLVTRNPQGLAEFAARGVQIRFGDFDKPESLREAFAGADKLLLISTLDVGERRRRQHKTAISAAIAGGVGHVVYTSSVGIHPHSPAFVIEDHLFTEEALRRSGLNFTFMRDAQYAEVITHHDRARGHCQPGSGSPARAMAAWPSSRSRTAWSPPWRCSRRRATKARCMRSPGRNC